MLSSPRALGAERAGDLRRSASRLEELVYEDGLESLSSDE